MTASKNKLWQHQVLYIENLGNQSGWLVGMELNIVEIKLTIPMHQLVGDLEQIVPPLHLWFKLTLPNFPVGINKVFWFWFWNEFWIDYITAMLWMNLPLDRV